MAAHEIHTVTLHHLDATTCRRMLARCRFGRVAFVGSDGQVQVFPVNCTFADGAIAFRTIDGSPLDEVADGRIVAFELDHVDPVGESGWSVLVRGPARRVSDQQRLDLLADTGVHAWAPGSHDRWVEIEAQRVTGRWIERQQVLSQGHRVPGVRPE